MKTAILAAAALAVVIALPANAVGVSSVVASNGNTATVFDASAGQLQIDFSLSSTSPVVVNLVSEIGDNGSVSFDSFTESLFTTINNGNPLRAITLTLGGGATFGTIGSVVPAFSSAAGVLDGTATSYVITFTPGETFGVELGDIGNGGTDFAFDTSAVGVGNAFSLTLGATAVPEPASWALLIGGFGLVGTSLRRRRTALAA